MVIIVNFSTIMKMYYIDLVLFNVFFAFKIVLHITIPVSEHLNKTNHLNRLCIKKQAGWEGSRFQVIFLFINNKNNIIKK